MADEDPQKPKPKSAAQLRAEMDQALRAEMDSVLAHPAPAHQPTLGEKISGTFGSLFPIGSAGESLQAGARMVGSRIPILNRRTGGPQTFWEALVDIQAAKRG